VKEPEARSSSLERALRAMADDEARIGASPALKTRLLAEVQSIGEARRRRTVIVACAMAAVVLFALTAPSLKFFSRTPSRGAGVAEVTTAFMPLVYGSVPATNVQIVRLAVPRAALASFGLTPLETVDRASTDTVLADVLVGDDGLARAVRFVRPAAGQELMP
jgi:hypothetical protein